MSKVILIEYILGNISVDSHPELKKLLTANDIEQQLKQITEELTSIAETTKMIEPDAGLKASIFAHIEQDEVSSLTGMIGRTAAFFQLSTDTIKEIFKTTNDFTLSIWENDYIKDTFVQHFDGGGDISNEHCGLVYLKEGCEIDKHLHLGEEWMLILSGSITTEDGKYYGVGDLLVSQLGSSHIIRANNGEPCLFAAVLFDEIEFI